MAGYSGTPLAKKLGIKPQGRVALFSAPADFPQTLAPLPEGVAILDGKASRTAFDVGVFFTRSESELERRIAELKRRLDPQGGLWIAWPKKASGEQTDLTEDAVRRIALATALVDNKVCAIDDIWSALRVVYRVADRPSPKPAKKPAKPTTAKKRGS